MPLIYFPIVIASLADGAVALNRISEFLMAEELLEPYAIDCEQKFAVDVNGDFTWETAKPLDGRPKLSSPSDRGATKQADKKASGKTGTLEPVLPITVDHRKLSVVVDNKEENDIADKPFELKNLGLKIPKGSFVAIVGRVGSGKVSKYIFIV